MDNYDVICIGAGSAGLPLAIRAAQSGARILQIEADNRIGGTLHWSSGQIAAAGTRLQKQNDIDDTPEEHFADAQRIANDQIDLFDNPYIAINVYEVDHHWQTKLSTDIKL